MDPVGTDPDPHDDDLRDMFDYISGEYVYSGFRRPNESEFRRLNGRLYKVDSLRKLQSEHYRNPRVDGAVNKKPYFNYYTDDDSEPVRSFDFSFYRRNPVWGLQEDEPSHIHIDAINTAVDTVLSTDETLKLRRRILRQRVEFEQSGLIEIDKTKLAPHETDAIILAKVDELSEERRKDPCLIVQMLQRYIDEHDRVTTDDTNKIRRYHYKIKGLQRKNYAKQKIQYERHRCLLLEIDRHLPQRLIHDDDYICQLQHRINRTHQTNFVLIHRIHNRILRRESKIKYNEDLFYDDTESEGEEDPRVIMENMDVVANLYPRNCKFDGHTLI